MHRVVTLPCVRVEQRRAVSSLAATDMLKLCSVFVPRAFSSAHVDMTVLPQRLRWSIVLQHEKGRQPDTIARDLGINVKTVYRWLHRYRSTGGVDPCATAGRPTAMSEAATERATALLVSSECGGARFVARQLRAEGLTRRLVAASTVVRAARAHAKAQGDPLLCRRGRPPKRLTEATKRARVAFARRNMRRDWGRVLFTDRCKFHFRYPGMRVRNARWMRRSQSGADGQYRPNRAQVYNVYAGFSKHGVTKVHPVTGTSQMASNFQNLKGQTSRNITADEYRSVCDDTLLPGGRRMFSAQGVSDWVLQQDGDPTHAAAKGRISDYNTRGQGTVHLLQDWPPNSPDLNPIENVWAWVDARVAAQGCQSFAEFKAAVDDKLLNLPRDMRCNLVASMPKRLRRVAASGGEKTGY